MKIIIQLFEIYIFSLLIILFSGCGNNNNKRTKIDTNDDKDGVASLLEKQLKEGYAQFVQSAGIELPPDTLDISNIEILCKYEIDTLEKYNYKIPSKEEFSIKIKEIFGRTININSDKKFLYINFQNTISRDFYVIHNDNINTLGTYIVKDNCYITDFYYLPEFIDYTKVFPQSINNEKEMSQTKYIDKYKDEIISIQKWKDCNQLGQIRRNNVNTFVNRNKYLFNGRDSSLAWLIINDKAFLSQLITTFDYDKEPKINKMEIEWCKKNYYDEDYYTNHDDYNCNVCSDVFVRRDYNGKMHIHRGLFETIKELTISPAAENTKCFKMLHRVISYDIERLKLTKEERTELYCNFARLEVDLNKKYGTSLLGLYSALSDFFDEETLEIAKSHNYYGIENFDEIIKVYEWDREHNNGEKHSPSFDYSTLK